MSRSRIGETTSDGITLGSAIAVAISWSVNESIWWCIGHGIIGWFYVIFYAMGWTDK